MKTLYYNGNIYTGEAFTEAFIVEDGRFVKTGNSEDLLKDTYDEKTDLGKRFVCASFNDSHMHLLGLGYSLNVARLDLHTSSLEDMCKYLKDFIAERDIKEGQWIRGRGWNQDYFTDVKRMPSRKDLDLISKDIPMYLGRTCGHCALLNSKAMELCHVDENTVSPDGGAIDYENGLFFDNAIDMVSRYVPAPDKEEIKDMIRSACKCLNSYGITSSQTDDYSSFRQVPYEVIHEAYREMADSGELTVRVFEQSNFTKTEELNNFIADGNITGKGDLMFKIGPLKLLGDGSLGSRSAALRDGYADDPDNYGLLLFSDEQMEALVSIANKHDMPVAVHAIGDRCLDQVLNVIEKALKEHPRKDHRHGIVHCQISRADQLQKIIDLDLHVYAQSVFLDYDNHIVEARVGRDLAATSYNWKTLLSKSVIISNGSDSPVELPNALKGIECAVTRTSLDGTGPYLPDQAFTVKEAIDSFTINSATASFEENFKGLIKEGYLADFVILEEDPFKVDKRHIHDIKIAATYLGGNCVYKNE